MPSLIQFDCVEFYCTKYGIRCRQVLRHHGMKINDCPQQKDVNFQLPKLQGKDILEHFYNIGEQQSKPYRVLIERLAECELPPLPETWVYKPGWHQYSSNGVATPVPFPPEDALVFDVEVCMHAGTNPTLACAASNTHWYGWVSDALIEGSSAPEGTVQRGLEDLVPLESGPTDSYRSLGEGINKPKVVVGHNVSYDRARVKEQYWLQRTGCRFLDTMSMHICVSGVTSYQRGILKSKDKEILPEDESWREISSLNSLAEVHKLYCGAAISKTSRDVFVEGSLQDVRQDFQNLMMYCAGDVQATARVLKQLYPLFRQRFPHPVTLAGMLELSTAYLPVNSNWLEYIKTADLTYEDVELESKFLLARRAERACKLMHGDTYKEDLWMWDQDWSTQHLKLNKEIVRSKKTKKANLTSNADDITSNFDSLTTNKSDFKSYSMDEVANNENIYGKFDYQGKFVLHEKSTQRNVEIEKLVNEVAKKCTEIDGLNGMDEGSPDPLEKKFERLLNLKSRVPVRKPVLPGYPGWYRKLCTKMEKIGDDWSPGPHEISTSMQVTPKLLSLSWEGYPLHFIRGAGWGFLAPFRADRPSPEESMEEGEGVVVPLEQLVQSCPVVDCGGAMGGEGESAAALTQLWKDIEKEIGKRDYRRKKLSAGTYSGSGVWAGETLGGCCAFMRLPHKDGPSKRVGNPLARDFLNKFSENVLAGIGEEAHKVLTSARMLSYWRNNRDRIRHQKVCWLADSDLPPALQKSRRMYGAILPQVVVCGTLTRRAMEPTWMTASNAHKERIGSELRAMVQSPPGHCFVGADVDSQELWIAAVLGDSGYGLHGATPLGWMTLSGSKAAGTDMHSHTAATAKVTRDHAKVINYARIYGAGQNFAERLLKQFNPTMSDGDAKSKALKMFASTKGRKFFRLRECHVQRVFGDMPPLQEELMMTSYQAGRLAKLNGMTLDDMFERPKWIGGTESDMFNKLEDIAGSDSPRTPFLGCRLTRALMSGEELRSRHLPTAVNWVVQSGAVDFLHLMLVNMLWLTGQKARFCLSFHDEVRYMVPEEHRYEVALAMHITNLYTRSYCAKKLGLNDLPLSVSFFTAVDVDHALRKEAHLDCATPSNPHGLQAAYGIPPGEALDIHATLDKAQPGNLPLK